jgi:hypothetical protein
MLVTNVLSNCPSCNAKDSFGNVSINEHLQRGCKRCNFKSMVFLPPIRKKVIYLDQNFFSAAMRGNDTRFSDAIQHVKRLCNLQLLIAPYSSVHEDETHQWRGYDGMTRAQLMEFVKDTSRGAKFIKAFDVMSTQVLKAWGAYLKRRSPEYQCESQDVVSINALVKWDSYFRIDQSGYNRDIELKRRLKNESTDGLMDALPVWRQSQETFSEAVALEIRDAGQDYLKKYHATQTLINQGEIIAALQQPRSVVESMLEFLPKNNVSEDIRQCEDFFNSQYFAQVPNEWIFSHMFAEIKACVKRGMFANQHEARKSLNGLYGDIKHISLYAPYCDAIAVDNFMADLVQKPMIDIEQRYGTKVFSLKSLDKLHDWLNKLETEMSDDHRSGVTAAYPGSLD